MITGIIASQGARNNLRRGGLPTKADMLKNSGGKRSKYQRCVAVQHSVAGKDSYRASDSCGDHGVPHPLEPHNCHEAHG